MEDQSKTKKVLIQELDSLRQRIAELEQSELERQQAEKTLHDFERRLRLVFEHSSDVIYTLDCDFRVTSVSPSVERYLGYRTEELVGKPFNDINVLAPESLEAAFKDALQTLAGGTVPTAEYVFIRKDGSRVIGEVSGSPLVEDGKIVGLISVARNITDRKRAEGALRDNETKLQAIFNAVGTGILIIDRDTQIIIEANQTAIEMTGLTKERIIGQICHSLVCPAQAGKCPVKDLGQSVDNSERKLIHADGHLKDILKTVYPITIKGRDCYVESFIDITDRKRAEEA
ncbi:MAG: PAS domain S-box protein, partial [Deltaproteobacteria bacterium]|nr:PAS domain S-box protein [Deltaproteobacteria bacterium]